MTRPHTFDIRLVGPDHPGHNLIGSYAFGPTPQAPASADDSRNRYLAESRNLMAFDGDEPVAKVSTHALTMNVRGTVMAMGGVGGVATMPAGRRGGRVRALMIRAFEMMREDGQAVSALYPFRESFYERLGYASLPAPLSVSLTPANLAPLFRMESRATVEHLLIADGFDTWVDFLERYQRGRHGFSFPNAAQRELIRSNNEQWLVIVREGDEVTGAMTYRIPGHGAVMRIRAFLTNTLTARYTLLEWIARHTDQVPTAEFVVGPGEHPELWLHDLDDRFTTSGEDNWGAPMARILDLAALSGAGAGDGDITLAVTDDQCPWNTGTWRLRGSGGELEVTEGGTPAATITIQGLSALLFNGIDANLLRFRGWGTPGPAAAEGLRSLFPPAQPFLHALF